MYKLLDDKLLNICDYTHNSVLKLTVDGVHTEIGVIAVLYVMEELGLALGPALTLLQNMVVMSVRERIKKHKLVMSNRVQVKKSFVCEFQLQMLVDTTFKINFAELNVRNSVC